MSNLFEPFHIYRVFKYKQTSIHLKHNPDNDKAQKLRHLNRAKRQKKKEEIVKRCWKIVKRCCLLSRASSVDGLVESAWENVPLVQLNQLKRRACHHFAVNLFNYKRQRLRGQGCRKVVLDGSLKHVMASSLDPNYRSSIIWAAVCGSHLRMSFCICCLWHNLFGFLQQAAAHAPLGYTHIHTLRHFLLATGAASWLHFRVQCAPHASLLWHATITKTIDETKIITPQGKNIFGKLRCRPVAATTRIVACHTHTQYQATTNYTHATTWPKAGWKIKQRTCRGFAATTRAG